MHNSTVQSSVGDQSAAHNPLIDHAIGGLVQMFDAEKQLFCYRLKRGPGDLLIREGLSRRYTMIALLGLHRGESNGLKSPIDIGKVTNGLVEDVSWITNIGDLGLLLWLCALRIPGRLEQVCSRTNVKDAVAAFNEARERRTTELAWFLSGLAHATLAAPDDTAVLRQLTWDTYDVLKKNQGPHGIFGHLTTEHIPTGVFRGRIGSFADQVYPIYALAKFGEVYNESAALAAATSCAKAICRVQGQFGQWWWHYDASSGRVCERYPVYSVHQDGMAPMALFALGEATGATFSGPIYKGLQWIFGSNELDCDLLDTSRSVIWRSIFHESKLVAYYRKALAFSRIGAGRESTADLAVKFECRPYHFGWLLYAFAGRDMDSSARQQ
jgi:hypothetical protein